MTSPDYQTLMLPLLQLMSDGKQRSRIEAAKELADNLGIPQSERQILLPSGKDILLNNRIGWTRFYLTKAGLLETPKRGEFRITARGRELLSTKPHRIDNAFLASQFAEFREFWDSRYDGREKKIPALSVAESTPEETLEEAHEKIQSRLKADVLENVKRCSPQFFEQLVIDLLVKMGFGGTRKDAGEAIGRSGDEGIDGIIKEDRLGLDTIYVQAKRWEGTVGRPTIQGFVGALQGHHARKGILITTSSFTKEATEYVLKIDTKVTLLDGATLAELMIDFEVGVTPVSAYAIKKVDSDYFLED